MRIECLLALVIAAAVPLLAHGGGCEYDTQCKGDRVCQNGQCVDGPATASSEESIESEEPSADVEEEERIPHYCCTAAGRLGPYDNPQNGVVVNKGEACYGTTQQGQTVYGRACF